MLKLAVALLLAVSAAHAADWVLVWEDNFDGAGGSAPNGGNWGYDTGGDGWGNNEREYYTTSTNNAALDGNGNLQIIARNDDASGYNCWYGSCWYTSARLLTSGKYQVTYGRFEANIKVPYGKGIWPAFWMLGADIGSDGWPQCGEIDIMELRGSNPNTVLGTIHGPGYSGAGGLSGSYSLPGGTWFSDTYHVFAVEWQPDYITWSVDGVAFETRTPADVGGNEWVFTHDFFILLDLAVGGNFDGDPDGSTTFPQTMFVDYVRVYEMAM